MRLTYFSAIRRQGCGRRAFASRLGVEGRMQAIRRAARAAAGAVMAGLAIGGAAQAGEAKHCVLGHLADLPVTMTGYKAMTPVKVNDQPVQFFVDSGAFYSIINPSAADRLKLSVVPTQLDVRGVGGSNSLSAAKVRTLTLAEFDLPDIWFGVGGGDLMGDGLIGQNVLSVADVEYDLSGGMVRLMRPRGCDDANLAYWAAAGAPVSVVPLDFASGDPRTARTIGVVYVNGVKLRAMFDTGAGGSNLTLAAAKRLGIKPGDPGVADDGYTRGFGRKTAQTWITPIASFRLATAGEEVRNTRLRIVDWDAPVDMIIGADFFLSHRVYVANSQHRLYVTYNGGPVFNLAAGGAQVQAGDEAPQRSTVVPGGEGEPQTAEAFSRRGAALAARRDFPHALADLDRAITLAPEEPRYYRQRAEIRLAAGEPRQAASDLDQALKRSPDDLEGLIQRAQLRLGVRDADGALADLDRAAAVAPRAAAERLALAQLYLDADAPERALPQADQWVDLHPDDSRVPLGLITRCRARVLLNRDLDKAARDCETALRRGPHTAMALTARAMLRLRQGQYDGAVADFDAALALKPEFGQALYARGLAYAAEGKGREADADFAAARALAPRMADRMARFGLGPPSAAASPPTPAASKAG